MSGAEWCFATKANGPAFGWVVVGGIFLDRDFPSNDVFVNEVAVI